MATTPSAPFQLREDEIEKALVTGEHADLLQRLFGAARYAELQQLARQANARKARGGPRVFVLPGIMGSKLGSPRLFLFHDTVWVDPIEIAAGKLLSLALIPGPIKHQAIGVIMLAYLKLKLSLTRDGYDAEFHPFDWRKNVAELGAELAARIAKDPAKEVSLVAHSMGGLVSRAALKHGAPKVKRLIQLGTPNYGSFVPIQALRGIYPVIRKIALIDLKHSPEQLTERVFSTFTGLYQMLPAPEKFTGLDVFDPANWPAGGPQPRPALLAAARHTQQLLAPPSDKIVLIAGVNQDTVTNVQLNDGQFVFSVSKEGDGTVPLEFAQLPDVRTYYIEESHGSLPNNERVADAVREILATGETSVLPSQWARARALPVARTMDESAVRRLVPDQREQARGAAISDQEVRHLLDEVAAPDAREEIAAPPEAAAYKHDFKQVIVGRRRQRRLEIHLAPGSITDVISDAYVLGIFRDVTPTGAARAVDERLDGAIAEFSRRRMFSGNVGEVFIVPTGSHLLHADVVLLAGMGAFDHFAPETTLRLVAENVIRTFIRTGVNDFATVLIGAGSGQNPAVSLKNLIVGFLEGLKDADGDHNFRRVTLCEKDPDQYAAMKEELYRLASTDLFQDVEVTFHEIEPLPSAFVPAAARGLVPVAQAPVYLLVRQEDTTDGAWDYRTSVLTSGGKAAVITGRRTVDKRRLNDHLAQLDERGFGFAELPPFGLELAELLLPESLLTVLSKLRQQQLVVVHDEGASRIPWETLHLRDRMAERAQMTWAPAAANGLSRRYLAENLSVAKWMEERRQSPTLNLLLVVNPTEDLDGAEAESRRVRELFRSHPGVNIVERRGPQARKATLLADFRSGQFDVLHYAGHAMFDPLHPARSGILCHGEELLSGAELTGLGNLPSLIFFNACEAGRIRGARAKPKAQPKSIREEIERNVGLAEAFLRGGAANYVGTYWPVGDDPAKTFAETFYLQVMEGKPLGDALLAGRQAVQKLKSHDWADYILYGSPDFVLKIKRPVPA